jgi:hypothetical protein
MDSAGFERCASCAAPLSGPYCSQCGERRIEPDDLTLRHFLVHTVVQELLSVDGALWRSLRLLLTRPGRLTLEYAAGRRRPYVNPFRLLLIAIVSYTVMASSGRSFTLNFGPVTLSTAPPSLSKNLSVEEAVAQIDRYGLLRQPLAAKRQRVEAEAAREQFHARLAAFAQPLSFTNVVLLAAALHLGFLWKRRRFLEHLAFSMHVVSFVLLSSVLLFGIVLLRFWLGPYVFLALLMVSLLQFGYLTVAIRRFYLADGRWTARLLAVGAALLFYIVNTVFMTAVQVAGAAIALAMA